jgi:hypothetical protein
MAMGGYFYPPVHPQMVPPNLQQLEHKSKPESRLPELVEEFPDTSKPE